MRAISRRAISSQLSLNDQRGVYLPLSRCAYANAEMQHIRLMRNASYPHIFCTDSSSFLCNQASYWSVLRKCIMVLEICQEYSFHTFQWASCIVCKYSYINNILKVIKYDVRSSFYYSISSSSECRFGPFHRYLCMLGCILANSHMARNISSYVVQTIRLLVEF